MNNKASIYLASSFPTQLSAIDKYVSNGWDGTMGAVGNDSHIGLLMSGFNRSALVGVTGVNFYFSSRITIDGQNSECEYVGEVG